MQNLLKRSMVLLLLLCMGGLSSCRENDSHSTQKGKSFPRPAIPFSPRHYVCTYTPRPLTIDGRMVESAWLDAEWTEYFTDIQGTLAPEPRFRTRAKMLWDDRFFYVFAELEEPHVWATLRKRDAIIFQDNDFEVFIDPNGDTHRYYELEVNAFGTFWDLFLDRPYRDNGKPLFFWDIRGIKIGVHINGTLNNPKDVDKGWNVEIAIPWAVLKECAEKPAPPEIGDVWRVNFSRVEWKTEIHNQRYIKKKDADNRKLLPEDNWVWSPQGLVNMHYPEMWGFVTFAGRMQDAPKMDFRMSTDDSVKWVLRQIYYDQKENYANEKRFNPAILSGKRPEWLPRSYRWPAGLKATYSLFEAVLMERDGRVKWHIDAYGRVWKSE